MPGISSGHIIRGLPQQCTWLSSGGLRPTCKCRRWGWKSIEFLRSCGWFCGCGILRDIEGLGKCFCWIDKQLRESFFIFFREDEIRGRKGHGMNLFVEQKITRRGMKVQWSQPAGNVLIERHDVTGLLCQRRAKSVGVNELWFVGMSCSVNFFE